jgi:hypothetical protein
MSVYNWLLVRYNSRKSLQEERVRRAIELSLNEQRGSWQSSEHLLHGPRTSSEERLLAAIAASVEEENVQRCASTFNSDVAVCQSSLCVALFGPVLCVCVCVCVCVRARTRASVCARGSQEFVNHLIQHDLRPHV